MAEKIQKWIFSIQTMKIDDLCKSIPISRPELKAVSLPGTASRNAGRNLFPKSVPA
jgi:hypothetical protein